MLTTHAPYKSAANKSSFSFSITTPIRRNQQNYYSAVTYKNILKKKIHNLSLYLAVMTPNLSAKARRCSTGSDATAAGADDEKIKIILPFHSGRILGSQLSINKHLPRHHWSQSPSKSWTKTQRTDSPQNQTRCHKNTTTIRSIINHQKNINTCSSRRNEIGL